MKLQSREAKELLAGRYVLGVMVGRARSRFESLLRYDPVLRAEVQAWEQRFAPIMEAQTPIRPPAGMRDAVLERVLGTVRSRPQAKTSSAFLGIWSAFATAAMLLLALVVVLDPFKDAPKPPAMHVAVLSNQGSQAAYLVCTDPVTRKSLVEVLQSPTTPDDHDNELWVVADGKAYSAGLLPTKGRRKFELEPALAAKLNIAAMAVSLEPKGGSPTGQPTGAVRFQGKIIGLWTGQAKQAALPITNDRLMALALALSAEE